MSIDLITNERAPVMLVERAKRLTDVRARWLARKKPEATKRIITTALGLLPSDMPEFCSATETAAFCEQIQYDTILALRNSELAIGITLEGTSMTRWQWVTERAIGEIVALVVAEYLS